MINMVIFCIFYLNRDNIVIKSSSINKPMRYSDKKHVKNGKKNIHFFLSLCKQIRIEYIITSPNHLVKVRLIYTCNYFITMSCAM